MQFETKSESLLKKFYADIVCLYLVHKLKFTTEFDYQCTIHIVNKVKSFYCPPPFRRKAEGHSFRHSVLPSVLPSVFPSFRPPNVVGTLCAQLLLQFCADSFETSQMFLSWSEDMHVVWI